MKYPVFLLSLICWKFAFSQTQAEKQIIDNMLLACEQVKACSFILASEERKKEGNIDKSEMLVKLQTHPTKIYVMVLNPNAGAEALWRQGEMKDHLLINPNGFPFVNLRFDPYNSFLRKTSHHTIKEIGFDYVVSMVHHYRRELGENFYSFLNITDTVQWEGRYCIRLTFDYSDFTYRPYTVGKGENATTIGMLNYVNDYMIVCANENMKDFHDVKLGQEVLVPNMFGKKVVFFVDRSTMLPLVQEVYDQNGLFEKYEMKSFILDPNFSDDEFTPKHKGYGF